MKLKILFIIIVITGAGMNIQNQALSKHHTKAFNKQTEKEDDSLKTIIPTDRITITKLINYGKEGNLEALASLFSYPIYRKYPILPINDSVDFVRYASVIWDDSLKQVLRNTKLEEWKQYGWRGYSFRNGNYFWVDGGKVFAINYFSAGEQNLWKQLVRNEITSLHPSLQEGIESPYLSFRTEKKEWYGRIDLMKNGKSRLAIYKEICQPDNKPYFVAEDSVYEREGSMGNENFVFFGDSVTVELFISRYVTSFIDITKNGVKESYDIDIFW